MSAACLSCDGATSLRASLFLSYKNGIFAFEFDARHWPGEGAFYSLDPNWIFIFPEVDSHAG